MKKTTAPAKVATTVEVEAQTLLDTIKADFDKDVQTANNAIAAVLAKGTKKAKKATEVKPEPVAVVAKKRVAIINTAAIAAELAPVLGQEKIAQMQIKFGKGTVAVKMKEEGKPARNVLTINEVYRKDDGSLVMALNTNSLPVAKTKLPKGVERKAHKTYFKHTGLTVETVAQIVKLNW